MSATIITDIDLTEVVDNKYLWFENLYDYTDGGFYLEEDLPVQIPLGHEVRAYVAWYNDTDADRQINCMAKFIDPDGVSVGERAMERVVPPNDFFVVPTQRVTLDKDGEWIVSATIPSGMASLLKWVAVGAAVGIGIAVLTRRK